MLCCKWKDAKFLNKTVAQEEEKCGPDEKLHMVTAHRDLSWKKQKTNSLKLNAKVLQHATSVFYVFPLVKLI